MGCNPGPARVASSDFTTPGRRSGSQRSTRPVRVRSSLECAAESNCHGITGPKWRERLPMGPALSRSRTSSTQETLRLRDSLS